MSMVVAMIATAAGNRIAAIEIDLVSRSNSATAVFAILILSPSLTTRATLRPIAARPAPSRPGTPPTAL